MLVKRLVFSNKKIKHEVKMPLILINLYLSFIDEIRKISEDTDQKTYEVLIGNREWMIKNELIVEDRMDKSMTVHEELGQTAVLVAINGRYRFMDTYWQHCIVLKRRH